MRVWGRITFGSDLCFKNDHFRYYLQDRLERQTGRVDRNINKGLEKDTRTEK